jgi:hypothetical protein
MTVAASTNLAFTHYKCLPYVLQPAGVTVRARIAAIWPLIEYLG